MTSAQAGVLVRRLRQPDGTSPASHPADADLLEQFAARRDEAAFAALVRRHGPMVLNVCRAVLRHEQDAEDALQATFLALARQAGSIRHRAAVAGWLFEVAHRVAARAQAQAARRRNHEQRVPSTVVADSTGDMTLRDLRRALHDDLRRLPDRYRQPLVLCYLEGRSHDEAARLLGWTRGTLRGRLDRGRALLRRRLAARGIALSAALCAVAAAPRVVAHGHVRAVVRAASGGGTAEAAALAEGVIRAMFMSKIKVLAAVVLAAGLILTAAMVQPASAGPDQPKPPVAKTPKPPVAASPPATDTPASMVFRGRVLGPDGTPVAGARLYLAEPGGYYREPTPSDERATSGPAGQFEFAAPNGHDDRWGSVVVAAAPKLGPGWVDVRSGGRHDDLTIRLVTDDVPITGQVVNLEGKPVAGVTLTVWQVHAAPDENIGPWVDAATAKKGLVLDLERKHFPRYTTGLCPKATTDADGRLKLPGIGRNRLVRAVIEGPTIASQHVCVLTRPGKPIDVVDHKGDREYGEPDTLTTYYGADFRLVAGPCQPIVGVVRDADTKKPIPGATVRSHSRMVGPSRFRVVDPAVRTKADADGRYRLLGLPAGKGYSVAVVPGKDQPYVARHVDVPAGAGVGQVKLDIELKRGVWIEGKISDMRTGKPVRGGVEYFSRYSNRHLGEFPGFDGTILSGDLWTGGKEDGSYRVVGLPGPGFVCVSYHRDPYLRAPDRDDEFGTKEKSLNTSPYHIGFTSNYNAIARVDPAKGADVVRCDITIDSGWTFKAVVEGPDGKPLAGGRACDLNGSRRWDRDPRPSAELAGRFNPRRPYVVVVRHPDKSLVGVGQPPKENDAAFTIKLGPGAAAAGRLVDADGKPLGDVELGLWFRPKGWGGWHEYWPEHVRADRDGRFRVDGLLPDFEYRLTADKGEAQFGDGLRPSGTKQIGDIKLRPESE